MLTVEDYVLFCATGTTRKRLTSKNKMEITLFEKSLAEQMTDLLKRNPENYDVTFSVGPDKIKVKAVKFILKAASPVFEREFKDKWDSVMMKNHGEIPLPDISPMLFELFINMIIRDKWSVLELNRLRLQPITLLSLRVLCTRFEITKAIRSLESSIRIFAENFHKFKDTDEFLKISRPNLETILSLEGISVDEGEVFECACRWAGNQCQEKQMALTGENFRKVLGDCLFKIRFPTMQFQDFTKISIFKKNILTADEKVAIYDFIGMNSVEKLNYLVSTPTAQLSFNLSPRKSFGCSVFCLPASFKIAENLPYECRGTQKRILFQVNQRISLHGMGFFGPISEDTRYYIDVQVKRLRNFSPSVNHPTFHTGILSTFARKGRVFHLLFDKPITVEPNAYDSSWKTYYCITCTIRGSTRISQYKVGNPKAETVKISGVEFNLDSGWTNGSPVAELLFKEM